MVGKSNDFLMIDDNARKYLRDTMGLHLDDSNMKRSTTNFDRSVASKMFNRSNQSLKVSHMTQSNFFGSSKSFSR